MLRIGGSWRLVSVRFEIAEMDSAGHRRPNRANRINAINTEM